MGTPHAGSDLAQLASIFGKLTSVLKKTNKALLSVLAPESEVLARIQQDFHNMLRARNDKGLEDIRITCFFEELAVTKAGQVCYPLKLSLKNHN